MIEALKVLLRVKELKERQVFRALAAKRSQVGQAKAAIEIAREHMRTSSETLPEREDTIYRMIMSRIVDLDEVDETKGKVQHLEAEHRKLVDAVERAIHVHARLEKELLAVAEAYRNSIKERDKYVALTEELQAEKRAEVAHRDEAEVEDLFGNRRRRMA